MIGVSVATLRNWEQGRRRPEGPALALGGKDTTVFLGDYIDRGPDTRGCIDRILRWQDESPATVITLLGNHEDWLLRSITDPARHSWLGGAGCPGTGSRVLVTVLEPSAGVTALQRALLGRRLAAS